MPHGKETITWTLWVFMCVLVRLREKKMWRKLKGGKQKKEVRTRVWSWEGKANVSN